MNAPNSLADLHHRLGKLVADSGGNIARSDPNGKPWDSNVHRFVGLAVDEQVRSLSYSTEATLAAWRATTPPERIAQLEAEWSDKEAAYEHARVKYGRGSSRYRAAVRAIERREFIAAHQPQPQEKRT